MTTADFEIMNIAENLLRNIYIHFQDINTY